MTIEKRCSECFFSGRAGPDDKDDWVCNFHEEYMTAEVTDCADGLKISEVL